MSILAGVGGFALILVILWDSFETIILPRRVTRRFRLARLFYRLTWTPWSAVARGFRPGNRQESFLSFFGPLSVILLFVFWALGMIFGFAILAWALGSPLKSDSASTGFLTDLYLSGTTFSTLGIGDVTPRGWAGRALVVVEAGLGFGFLAIVISYLPVLFGAFSRREVNISLIDARAGSPPTAGELLRRHLTANDLDGLTIYLGNWETWAAELMESHLSYPVLCYFRSQHSNQSWLAALTAIMDTCSLLAAYGSGRIRRQARLTFAISRHALVDLSQVLHAPPLAVGTDRLRREHLPELRALLRQGGIESEDPCGCDHEFERLQQMYESYIHALSARLMMPLPPWINSESSPDNWITTARVRAAGDLSEDEEEH